LKERKFGKKMKKDRINGIGTTIVTDKRKAKPLFLLWDVQ
jgi:hypothetical protein